MVRVEEHALWQVRTGQQLAEAVAGLPVPFFLLFFLVILSNFHIRADPLADNSAGVAAAVGNGAVGSVLVLPRSACWRTAVYDPPCSVSCIIG
jgi:hypothetical protein